MGAKPYFATVVLTGVAQLLFHRWDCDSIDKKSKSSKGSKEKKSDDVESYVYRASDGTIAIPGEYLRQALIHAAKFRQDPRSPRKSAMDIFKAGLVVVNEFASLGKKKWDYLDRRRVMVQRSGITRERPAMHAGWQAVFELEVILPEYIERDLLKEVCSDAGRLIGIGDFRPTFGRFLAAVTVKK